MRVSFHTYPPGWPWLNGWRRRNRDKHQKKYIAGRAFRSALDADGVTTHARERNKPSPDDVAVIWGWKQSRLHNQMLADKKFVIILELGFIQPRNQWVSIAVNGFNGRGHFAPASDNGARWEKHFSHHLKPWREGDDGYALVIGQVPGDAALHGQNVAAWAKSTTAELIRLGHRVVYRPHPKGPTPCPPGAELSSRSLEEDFAGAARVVVYNSTTAVESVLAGIPTVVMDIGSVAYPMASHALDAPLVRPDRTRWCHDMAWRQWTLEELANGTAWNHVKQLLPTTFSEHLPSKRTPWIKVFNT